MRRKVGKTRVCGSLLTVAQTDRDEELRLDDGTDAAAWYQADHNLIVIDSRLPADAQLEKFYHELGHAVFDKIGLSDIMLTMLPEARAAELEEFIVDKVLPAFIRARKDAHQVAEKLKVKNEQRDTGGAQERKRARAGASPQPSRKRGTAKNP